MYSTLKAPINVNESFDFGSKQRKNYTGKTESRKYSYNQINEEPSESKYNMLGMYTDNNIDEALYRDHLDYPNVNSYSAFIDQNHTKKLAANLIVQIIKNEN